MNKKEKYHQFIVNDMLKNTKHAWSPPDLVSIIFPGDVRFVDPKKDGTLFYDNNFSELGYMDIVENRDIRHMIVKYGVRDIEESYTIGEVYWNILRKEMIKTYYE